MTLAQALQLYTPLAGLVLMAFWLGVLSNRVSTLEREERDRKTREALTATDGERIVRVETKLDGAIGTLESLQREMAGVQRALGNIASGKSRPVQLIDE